MSYLLSIVHFPSSLAVFETKGRIFSEIFWYYFDCPKNILCPIISFVFWIFPPLDTAVQLESADSKQNAFSKSFFQKVWYIFLTAQKMCWKLSWKNYFEIAFCLESADFNCTAVSELGKIQNTKLRIERSTFFGQWK